MKKILVFASGSKTGGGSGFRELVENSKTGVLSAEIIGVVSNYEDGGVYTLAKNLNIPFVYFPKPWDEAGYKKILGSYQPDLVALSGWLKLTKGLDPRTTINIHPGPLPELGGAGMYGHHVHEAAVKAFSEGRLLESAVSMHFVTDGYDEGPVFFRYPVQIRKEDTPETLASRVNKIEHGWQSWVTDLVLCGEINWDGKNPNSLKVPSWYPFFKIRD